jgi:hypothetical protein
MDIQTKKQDKQDKQNIQIKIKVSGDDININGRVYFIPDKYIGNTLINYGHEYAKLYKIMISMYLDLQITNFRIENVARLTKHHMIDASCIADKLLCYITTGKIYTTNLSITETQILDKIPESLLYKVNLKCIEKIDV